LKRGDVTELIYFLFIVQLNVYRNNMMHKTRLTPAGVTFLN